MSRHAERMHASHGKTATDADSTTVVQYVVIETSTTRNEGDTTPNISPGVVVVVVVVVEEERMFINVT